jgi:hypothetical protein
MSPAGDIHVTRSLGTKKGIRSGEQSSSSGTGTATRRPEAASHNRQTTTTELIKQLKAQLWGYYQGERKVPVPPPEAAIVKRCVEALGNHTIEDLEALLRDRFRRGYRPGTDRGPRDYTWFVRVIENAFQPQA